MLPEAAYFQALADVRREHDQTARWEKRPWFTLPLRRQIDLICLPTTSGSVLDLHFMDLDPQTKVIAIDE
jgi:hypothetical protein